MKTFSGDIDELKSQVNHCGICGEWEESNQGDKYTFRGKGGEILNWWPKKGTVQFQGKGVNTFKEKLSMNINSGNDKQSIKSKTTELKKYSLFMGMIEMLGINLSFSTLKGPSH